MAEMKNQESGGKSLVVIFNDDVWVFKLNSDDEIVEKLKQFVKVITESPCG
jgi:uncharacterized spore protein YtfJ